MKFNDVFRLIKIPILMLAILWAFHIVYEFTGSRLGLIGVYPRHPQGIVGIFAAPLLHGDWQHLISNSLPFLFLTTIVIFFYRRVAFVGISLIWILTGLSVWLFGRNVIHIGASGVVYGLVAFVFWNGVFRRNIKSIILALIVVVLYSGYFYGILPDQEGISWESHLLGGVVGIIVSYLLRNRIEQDEEEKPDPFADEINEEKKYFLDRNIFDQTKKERANNENPLSGWTSDHS